MNRRTLMKRAGASLLTATVVKGTASSYTRILGANDRIVLGQLGCGQRSSGHVHMVHLASQQLPVEVAAVCDLWSVAREERSAQVKKAFKLEPKQYQYSEQMLANKDIDAVLIATGDFPTLYRSRARRQGLLCREAVLPTILMRQRKHAMRSNSPRR